MKTIVCCVLLFLVAAASAGQAPASFADPKAKDQDLCQADIFTPCNCWYSGNDLNVMCQRIPIDEIQSVFAKAPSTDYGSIYIQGSPDIQTMPADLLSGKRSRSFSIEYYNSLVNVDINAFQSLDGYVTDVYIYYGQGPGLTEALSFPSVKSFRVLYNNLISFPASIARMSNLESLEIQDYSFWTTIPSNAIVTSARVSSVSLYGLFIIDIAADAFQGDFGDAVISFQSQLRRFEENVFYELLLSMAGRNGGINLNAMNLNKPGNTMCDCSIAWLLRDNRWMLPKVTGGYCQDLQMTFEEVPIGYYGSC